jgi:hypothetical protein
MLCVIFWVVPRHVVFNSRRFGTLCLFHFHMHVVFYSRRFGTLYLFHLHRRVHMKFPGVWCLIAYVSEHCVCSIFMGVWCFIADVSEHCLYSRERDPVAIVQETGWARAPVWTDAENLAPTEIRLPAVQPVTSHTD